MQIHPQARWTNALGDGLMAIMHVVFMYKVLKRGAVTGRRAKETRLFTLLYYVCIISFQGQGALMHVTSPVHAASDLFWYAYVVAGCLSPSFYGAALSLDLLPKTAGRAAAAAWCGAAAFYIAVMVLQVDLADLAPFPRAFYVPFPNGLARRCLGFAWMPALLARHGLGKGLGDADLTLTFDGRGYAATTFEDIFDPSQSGNSDLVAAFPDWRTQSLGTLMLFFGVSANFVHLLICGRSRASADEGRRGRAGELFGAHRGMFVALVSMPPAMLCGGVRLGIDCMHACAAPGMYVQAKCLAAATAQADAEGREEVRKAI